MRAAFAALPGYGRRHPIRKCGRHTSRAYNGQVPHRARHARPSLPASIVALRHYSRRIFLSDLIAGVTVGLVALPLAMAFAISSGMTPQAGIYTAIVSGFLISALGGSYVQIGGPTGAFVVVVSGIIAAHGQLFIRTARKLYCVGKYMIGRARARSRVETSTLE